MQCRGCIGEEEMASDCALGGLDWILGKASSLKEWSLEQAAQGNGRVTIPENVQKTCGCHSWGHGFMVGFAVLG